MLALARRRTRLRAALAATAVALATILAVVGAYSRAPTAVLGIAFARACAAESAVMERTQPRLRVDDEDVHVEDIEGFLPSVEGAKAAPPRDRVEQPALRRPATLALRRHDAPNARPDQDPGIDRVPITSPTRERARLMVFLN